MNQTQSLSGGPTQNTAAIIVNVCIWYHYFVQTCQSVPLFCILPAKLSFFDDPTQNPQVICHQRNLIIQVRPYTNKYGEPPPDIYREEAAPAWFGEFCFKIILFFCARGSCLHESFKHLLEMSSQGRAPGPRAASYPCGRLRKWSRQTFWRYSLGTALLFRQYPVLTIELRSGGTLSVPHCFSSSILYSLRTSQHRPPRTYRSGAKSSRNSPRRVRKWGNNWFLQWKTSSQSQWSGSAPTGTRAWGASGGSTRQKTLCTHAIDNFFSGRKLGLYQQSLTARSIFEHASICSPSQFAHLHGKPHRRSFRLQGTHLISIPFWVAIHKSMLAFMGARTDTLQWGQKLQRGQISRSL